MNKNKFYIATAIAYTSAIPHIGNVYEVILADAISRFKRLDGFDVYFQTGTDEHGQKISIAAKKQNISEQEYVNYISGEIKKIYDSLNVKYDYFVRTTDDYHIKAVQTVYEQLLKQGDIYKGSYEGYYSLAEEAYVNEADLIDGKTKLGDEPIWMKEEAYFLKLSKYQDRLIKHIQQNPDFITPESRRNEILSFLQNPLLDVSVTRTLFSWGIPMTFDKKHISYVWIDALLNYLTGVGYLDKKREKEFKKYWPCDLHVVGKDIVRFHAIFFPIMLMALGIPLPHKIFGHPWILVDKRKMSKSLGQTVYADFLVKHFGVDRVRYYCLHEIPQAQDGNLTYELMIERSNSDLTNTLGNLLNRTIGMIKKYRGGKVGTAQTVSPHSTELKNNCLAALGKIRNFIDAQNIPEALEVVIELARLGNKYIDLMMPWDLFKNKDDKTLDEVLFHLLETLRFITILINPFLPDTANNMAKQLNLTNLSFSSLSDFGKKEITPGEPEIIFERYNLEEKMTLIIEDENKINQKSE